MASNKKEDGVAADVPVTVTADVPHASAMGIPPEINKNSAVLSLDEFCLRLSTQDKRVEMISGFHITMKAKKKLKATEAEYSKLFADFGGKAA